MKIFVTGATGFVGRHLTKALLQKGHEVFCLVRNRSKAREILDEGIQLVEGDVKDERSYQDILMPVDLVYHLAGSVFATDPILLFDTNTRSTEKLFLNLKRSNAKRLVFLSSLAAVGPVNSGDKINENTIPRPVSSYGKSKLEAEKILKVLAPQVKKEVCIVRAPLIYGIGMSMESRLALFVKRLQKGTFTLVGNGDNPVSLCQIKTAVSFLISTIAFRDMGYEIFHIADPSNITLRQLAMLAASHIGISLPNRRIPLRLALAIAFCLSTVRKLIPVDFYLVPERVLELAGNWSMDLSKVRRWSFEPDSNWEDEFLRTVSWLHEQVKSR